LAGQGSTRFCCTAHFEQLARGKGYLRIAGVDEAGRGALFGSVFAAAVILNPQRPVRGLRDSKQLSAERRERLAAEIRENALAWAVAAADAAEIDRINILEASRLAMRRAIEQLQPAADYLLVDAVRVDLPLPQQALIKGDARCQSIAAASILAKVDRDCCMREWDRVYPQYGLARHKGYPTVEHLEALAVHGAANEHRLSYAPVREIAAGRQLGITWQTEAAAAR
jgi:ribonuclease HII